jgi:hypothetical protein
MSTSTGIPTSTTTLIAASTRGKARARVNGSMMPAIVVESHTRTRELPRSTIKEQAAKVRSPGRLIEEKMARVQEGLQRNRQAPDRGERIVEDRQALLPRTVADSRMPSPGRIKEVMPRWRATVARQAVKACPPSPRREVEAVPVAVEAVAPVAAAVLVVAAVAAAVAVAVVEEDKEERI